MILPLDDRAENVEAAVRLGINSVLFDMVEKTSSRVESRFDIPVPSYGRRRQSCSQYNSTNRRPERAESAVATGCEIRVGNKRRKSEKERLLNL